MASNTDVVKKLYYNMSVLCPYFTFIFAFFIFLRLNLWTWSTLHFIYQYFRFTFGCWKSKMAERVFSRMRRSVTAESIPTKFCTSTPWGDVVIYLTWHRNWLRGFGGVGCENGPLPLASNTAYCATAHTRDDNISLCLFTSSTHQIKLKINKCILNDTPSLMFSKTVSNIQMAIRWKPTS